MASRSVLRLVPRCAASWREPAAAPSANGPDNRAAAGGSLLGEPVWLQRCFGEVHGATG